MFDYIKSFYQRYFTDPQVALLVVLLVFGFVMLLTMGKMLMPVLVAIVLAYLLESIVTRLERLKMARAWAIALVFIGFIAGIVYIFFVLMPLLSQQISQFFQEVPNMINKGKDLLLLLPEKYPSLIDEDYIAELTITLKEGFNQLGQNIISVSFASIPKAITILVYLVLVPFMIFFFLKDKQLILLWLTRFLPKERQLVDDIWGEMNAQIGNYIRGKVIEMITVGVASYIVFAILGLNYASLLAILISLSVLIPYIGAVVVTIPIALVGYFQWGLNADFIWVMIWYVIIQFIDGNILVPLLFSKAVNLHPIAIILAILVFGGYWGIWGVFFAIPLATLVKTLINIWPIREEPQPQPA